MLEGGVRTRNESGFPRQTTGRRRWDELEQQASYLLKHKLFNVGCISQQPFCLLSIWKSFSAENISVTVSTLWVLNKNAEIRSVKNGGYTSTSLLAPNQIHTQHLVNT